MIFDVRTKSTLAIHGYNWSQQKNHDAYNLEISHEIKRVEAGHSNVKHKGDIAD